MPPLVSSRFYCGRPIVAACGTHPLTLSAGNKMYHLRLQPAVYGVWSPNYFTSFLSSASIKEKLREKKTFKTVLVDHLLASARSRLEKTLRRLGESPPRSQLP